MAESTGFDRVFILCLASETLLDLAPTLEFRGGDVGICGVGTSGMFCKLAPAMDVAGDESAEKIVAAEGVTRTAEPGDSAYVPEE